MTEFWRNRGICRSHTRVMVTKKILLTVREIAGWRLYDGGLKESRYMLFAYSSNGKKIFLTKETWLGGGYMTEVWKNGHMGCLHA